MVGLLDSIPDNALNVGLIQPGYGHAFPDGLVHRKLAPCIIIAQALRGSYEVECRGRTIVAREEEAFLAATNDPLTITHHWDRKRGGRMDSRWLHVHFTLFETVDFSSLLNIPMKCDRRYGRRFGEIIGELLEMQGAEAKRPFLELVRRRELVYKALRILCELSPAKAESSQFIHASQRLASVFSFINENIRRPVSVQDLADTIHMSLSRFHAFFVRQMRVTPMDYVKTIRLTKASHKLMATELSIGEIADAVGFSNQFHFSREFKSRFGMTPSQYRETHGYPKLSATP